MTLIDTTVWIDFLNGVDTSQVNLLTEIIKEGNICISGIIITEILQGIKDDREFEEVKNLLTDIPVYETRGIYTYLHAAQIYRKCKREGYTLRKTIDCVIAAIALENDLMLLHNDRDFDLIAKCVGLKAIRD
ncbi:MAG: PIN domain nuclease [Elusimicrobiota bacterium]